MVLKIYNTLSRKKEQFIAVESDKVKMYVCGMTVYSDAHIGHARTYLAFDVIRRYLEYKDFKVTYIQNITDVDDKIIAAANREGVDPLKYSERFANRCLKDLDDLGIRRADLYPKASETIPDMIEMIQQLIKKGFAYEIAGDVYFSVEKFEDYGKLSGQHVDEMKTGVRIDPGEQKHAPLDFALWKKAKPGEPSWDSPWGKGRPGWHIECSAMSSKYLGLPFDIHGGGMDLRFPHHENEIAQAQAATGKLFARYWMHIGLLTVNGEKMSKSLGNFTNVRTLLDAWDAEVIRMFFAQNQYRSPPDFTEKALQDVKKGLDRIHRTAEKLKTLSTASEDTRKQKESADEQDFVEVITTFKKRFEQAMDDDFNTPKAFAEIFDFITSVNRFLEENKKPSGKLCVLAYTTLVELGNILTLFQTKPLKNTEDNPELQKKLQLLLDSFQTTKSSLTIEEILKTLLDIRENARKEKDWKKADAIRSKLLALGYEIQDTTNGSQWRKT